MSKFLYSKIPILAKFNEKYGDFSSILFDIDFSQTQKSHVKKFLGSKFLELNLRINLTKSEQTIRF